MQKNKKTKKKTSTKQKKKLSLKSRWLRRVILGVLALFGVGVVLSILLIATLLRDLPSPTKLNSPDNFAVSTKIFDRHGVLLYEIFADENRTPIKLKDLPEHVYQASISIEDKNFYTHFGFDALGIIRAIRNTLSGETLQGGSTITQQLVKNALLTREKTLTRKFKEAILTIATEVLYSKDEILEMYLNHIPYGGTSWGIEAAAQTYFDKPAKDLSIAQSALLAGLPQAPSRYSPFQSDPTVSKNRQADVLRRMKEDGFITQEEEDAARKEELKFALSKTDIKAPHFVFYVKDQLVRKYGEEKVEKGGLRVRTTLDLSLHEVAQASLSAEVDKLKRANVGNGAALITKPNTGEVLSMIGSKDYFDATADGKVNVTIKSRQPGSSFKPLNLAIAFEQQRLTPSSVLLDIPTCFSQQGSSLYCPKNYDNSFRGPVQQRFALGNSYNIPAVKVAYLNGVETVINMTRKMGITTYGDPSDFGIAIGLGAGEVRMTELAEAFGVLANQGVRVPLLSILEVRDYNGNLLEENSPVKRKVDLEEMALDESVTMRGQLERVMHRAPTFLVDDILQDNSARQAAFGSRSKLVIPDQIVSVKTGTTNNLRDNWTVGYTPEFLTAVWVGNNDNTAMNRNLVSGVTGAAPIWNDIMSYLLKDQQPAIQSIPNDVVKVPVCTLSGLLPNPASACSTREEYFWQGTEPQLQEKISRDIFVNSETGIPLQAGQSSDGVNLVPEKRMVISDPFTSNYCLDCARKVDEKGKVQYERYVISANHDPFAYNLEEEYRSFP